MQEELYLRWARNKVEKILFLYIIIFIIEQIFHIYVQQLK